MIERINCSLQIYNFKPFDIGYDCKLLAEGDGTRLMDNMSDGLL
jgi:hypothetical protein